MSVLEDLENYFGVYRPPAKVDEWEAAKLRLPIGATVQGTVMARYEFGVWLDVGIGYPALLLVTKFGDSNNHRFKFPDDYPEIGSLLTGTVYVLVDQDHAIGITQK